jgi:hypothetical protein
MPGNKLRASTCRAARFLDLQKVVVDVAWAIYAGGGTVCWTPVTALRYRMR